MRNNVIIFLKGVLMGICDMIPGISGGTIAFITGIYTRLIKAIKGFSPQLIIDFFKCSLKRDEDSLSKVKEDIKKLDLAFLIPLGIGIGTAILIGSRIITYLLENYFAYTMSFFIGLILASSKIIFKNIKNHHFKNILFGFIGIIVGILLSILIPLQVDPTLLYTFVGGFLAISAMFLPGISGAYILLILGIYEFMLKVLHNILDNISYFLIFIVGAILGAFTISRVISFLFSKDRCKTLYFLLGLVIGSLSIPIKRIYKSMTLLSSWQIIVTLLIFLFSFYIVHHLEKRTTINP